MYNRAGGQLNFNVVLSITRFNHVSSHVAQSCKAQVHISEGLNFRLNFFLSFRFVFCLFILLQSPPIMSRIALETIPSLTFYKDAITAARRTNPISQLVCIGKPCALYQPDVVHCKNIGGSGTDVDWKVSNLLNSRLLYLKT